MKSDAKHFFFKILFHLVMEQNNGQNNKICNNLIKVVLINSKIIVKATVKELGKPWVKSTLMVLNILNCSSLVSDYIRIALLSLL